MDDKVRNREVIQEYIYRTILSFRILLGPHFVITDQLIFNFVAAIPSFLLRVTIIVPWFVSDLSLF